MPFFSVPSFQPSAGRTPLVALLAVLTGAVCPATWAADVPRHDGTLGNPSPGGPWSGSVGVARLIAAADIHHPTREATLAHLAAAAAQVRQAGQWDNPEFAISVGRTRPRLEGLDRDTPYGGSLSQRLTWWGVRNARIAAARARQGAVDAEGQVARLVLQAEVRRAAIAYAVAHEALAHAEAEARISQELAAQTLRRQRAGEAAQATVVRARLEAATADLGRDRARQEVVTALAVLRLWCDPALPEGLVIGDALDQEVALDAGHLTALAGQHPQLRALAQAAGAAAASAEAERQSRIPELTVGVFADREDDRDTLGATLGFDIPLWHRNEAGIAAAEAEQSRIRAEARRERLRLERDLAEALGTARTAQGEAAALRDQALPLAEEAIRLGQAAFQAGDGSLADVLEARRAAFTVHAALREARRRAALAVVDLGVAVGDPTLGGAIPGASRP